MKLLTIPVIIVMYSQLGRYLFTGAVLLPGTGHRARRSERPGLYWSYIIEDSVVIAVVTIILCIRAKLL